jgi:hypothetical protein
LTHIKIVPKKSIKVPRKIDSNLLREQLIEKNSIIYRVSGEEKDDLIELVHQLTFNKIHVFHHLNRQFVAT